MILTLKANNRNIELYTNINELSLLSVKGYLQSSDDNDLIYHASTFTKEEINRLSKIDKQKIVNLLPDVYRIDLQEFQEWTGTGIIKYQNYLDVTRLNYSTFYNVIKKKPDNGMFLYYFEVWEEVMKSQHGSEYDATPTEAISNGYHIVNRLDAFIKDYEQKFIKHKGKDVIEGVSLKPIQAFNEVISLKDVGEKYSSLFGRNNTAFEWKAIEVLTAQLIEHNISALNNKIEEKRAKNLKKKK